MSSNPRRVAPCRIVVVEDNIDVAQSLELFLQSRSFDVRLAHDCTTGIAAIREHRPHIVFSDIGLPDSSGLHLAFAVRREFGSRLTLVAVTARSNVEDIAASLAAGFNAHVVKPANPFELAALASAAIERAGATSAPLLDC